MKSINSRLGQVLAALAIVAFLPVAALAQLAPPAPAAAPTATTKSTVVASLKQYRVTTGADGKEKLEDAAQVRPGDLIAYTRVVLDGNEGLLRMGLSEVEGKLDPKHFARIHRGLIINLRHVHSARRDEFGRVVVSMSGRQERLIVSRPYEHLFRDGFL